MVDPAINSGEKDEVLEVRIENLPRMYENWRFELHEDFIFIILFYLFN
jgi:hypothetical protein